MGLARPLQDSWSGNQYTVLAYKSVNSTISSNLFLVTSTNLLLDYLDESVRLNTVSLQRLIVQLWTYNWLILYFQMDKALQSMEEEAEGIFEDERVLLREDEAASARDTMLVQYTFVWLSYLFQS